MDRTKWIDDFTSLGNVLRGYLCRNLVVTELDNAIKQSTEANTWFTDYHIKEQLSAIANQYLHKEKLSTWLANYPNVWHGYKKDITVVMAGNIHLVGYHDYLSVLASGRTVSVKRSHKDAFLLPALHRLLCSFAPEWHSRIRFVDEVPNDTDGLIATGSDETAAWFTANYPHLPKIIRGHRVSVAVVPAEITQKEVIALHRDMFLFFGLGCRSVVHLFIPKGFDLEKIKLHQEVSHSGFRNAYQRQKALLTMQKHPFFDGGFFLLQQSNGFFPPMATIFYTYYSHINEAISCINDHVSVIQCVVGRDTDIKNCSNFGTAQNPQLWDYADGIDTMKL
jgi:hypothetical protein